MKSALISGGFGYIGIYMTEYFLKHSYKVGVLTRCVPHYCIELAQKVDVYIVDITKPINIKLMEKYDCFIHLASANDIISKKPKKAIEITALGTKYILDFCLVNELKKFIYFSTFQVYGVDSGFINERHPVNPINDYALTHYFAEEYVKMYHRTKGLDYLILRPANIYGAPINQNIERWSLVPNCFCKEAVEKQKITLLSSGKQQKDFSSLEEVVKYTYLLLNDFNKYKNKIINIASGKGTSIIQIAYMVKNVYEKLTGKTCEIEICSGVPVEAEDITISLSALDQLKNLVDNTNHTMEKEISKIINLLRS